MAVMTAAAQRTALKAFLESLEGIRNLGVVHDYRRIIRSEDAIESLMKVAASETINCWMISPQGAATTVTERHPGFKGIGQQGGGQAMTVFQWQLEGYFGLDDSGASEKTFFDLCEFVATELNKYGGLAIAGLVHQLPANVEAFGYSMVGGQWLMHYGRIDVAFQGRTVEG